MEEDYTSQAREVSRKIEEKAKLSTEHTKKAIEHARKAKEKIGGMRSLDDEEKKLAEAALAQAKRTAVETEKAGAARKETAKLHAEVRGEMEKAEKRIGRAGRKTKNIG